MVFMLGGLVALVVILLVVFIPSKEFLRRDRSGSDCRGCMGDCMNNPRRRPRTFFPARVCARRCGGQCTVDDY